MSGLLAVVPVLDVDIARPCIETLWDETSAAGLLPSQIFIVDNTKEGIGDLPFRVHRNTEPPFNNGVARSWNMGARQVLEQNLDYLLIVSASMQFGPALNTTWLQQMERFWGETVIEADGHSWHLLAIHKRVFDEIGLFDENFFAYFEQIDFGYRMRMAGLEHSFRRVWVNALSTGIAAHLPLIDCPAPPQLEYYRWKWNGDKGKEQWVQPFGSKPLDYWEPVDISTLAERYGWREGRWW